MALRAKPDYAANFAAQWLESDLVVAINSHRHCRTRVAEAAPDAKFNLIGRYPRRSHNRLQSRGVIARGLCLRRASHFVQDLGEHEILPRQKVCLHGMPNTPRKREFSILAPGSLH